MNLFYNDFDKRFLNVAHPLPKASQSMSDAEVINELAQLWIDSGGDAGGFDESAGKIRAEIKRLEGAK